MTWYPAPSLSALRAEVNAMWPNRDRTSDGIIGDTAHSSRVSDHNPDEDGSVNAWDVDVDGVNVAAIIHVFESDPRAKYWIYAGQIATAAGGWVIRPYHGANRHTAHIHLSFKGDPWEDDPSPWGLIPNTTPTHTPPEEDPMSTPEVLDQLREMNNRLALLNQRIDEPAEIIGIPIDNADRSKGQHLYLVNWVAGTKRHLGGREYAYHVTRGRLEVIAWQPPATIKDLQLIGPKVTKVEVVNIEDFEGDAK